MSSCPACHGLVKAKEEAVSCCKCERAYHRLCASAQQSTRWLRDSLQTWVCPICLTSEKRCNKDDTPVKSATAATLGAPAPATKAAATKTGARHSPVQRCDTALPPPPPPAAPASGNAAIATSISSADINSFAASLRICREEFERFKPMLSEFGASLNLAREDLVRFGVQLADMSLRIEAVEHLQGEVAELKKEVTALKAAENERSQEQLANNIEINGVNEQRGENLGHLLEVISQKIGVPLDTRDIDYVTRVGPSRSETERPRPIVARFTRRALKGEWMQAARVRRGLSCADVVAGPPRKIFVNENLTYTNRQLFRAARAAAKEHGYKYVWTRNGRILMRRNEGAQPLRIRVQADLDRFGCMPPSMPIAGFAAAAAAADPAERKEITASDILA